MPKAKSSQAFSPAATRIYQAAKTGITARTNPGHVKRVIDKELDKYALSTNKIKKEIHDAVIKANAIEVRKTEKFFDKQISELNTEIKDLQGDAKTFVKTATKELKDENSVFKQQMKTLTKENEALSKNIDDLLKNIDDLTGEVITLKNPKSEATSDQEKTETSPNPDQEKKSSGKKK